jgi:putative ABC transport system substrate-binding protein
MATPGQGRLKRRLAAILTAGVGRREFTALVVGAAAVWPSTIVAQPTEKVRRIGVLYADSATGGANDNAFRRELQELGWTGGRNVRINEHNVANVPDRIGVFAKELVALQPDVILGESTPVIAALLRETRTIPVVFVQVPDPVGSGFVQSLARPGANVTGFTFISDNSVVGKWLGLLKEIAPHLSRIAFLFNPQATPAGGSEILPIFEAAASSLAVEAIKAPVHDDAEIQEILAALGREPVSGVIVSPDFFISTHDALIRSLAARYRVPAIYPRHYSATLGGLISYGIDVAGIFRQAASYVDRILRGVQPAALPVQQPTKFELVINLKTAKALGLTIPPTLLARADEVIE